jgi:hypothetical protein
MANHVVMLSGGKGSFLTALRVKASIRDVSELKCIFTDPLFEDSDLYRFLIEAAAVIYDIPLTAVADLAAKARSIPPLEYALKGEGDSLYIDEAVEEARRQAIKALGREVDPDVTVVYLGYDWTEEHRYNKALPFWEEFGYVLACPLLDPPYIDKGICLEDYGISEPQLYVEGFGHNNCSGACVKAGQGHYALLYDKRPRLYLYLELKEINFRKVVGKYMLVSILRRKEYGKNIWYPLTEFRADIEAGKPIDRFDIGGCGCFAGGEDVRGDEI